MAVSPIITAGELLLGLLVVTTTSHLCEAWTAAPGALLINLPCCTSNRGRTTTSASSCRAVSVRQEEGTAPAPAALVDDDDDRDDDDSATARSEFGTRRYWDDMYSGFGDFSAEEYSWYYGWDVLGKHVREHLPLVNANGLERAGSTKSNDNNDNRDGPNLLVPGVGNDPILLDLLSAGYRRITAQDYSEPAIDRQRDLLWYFRGDTSQVELSSGDVRRLPPEWTGRYDAVVEKGLLDAVYLSGDNHVEQAVESLKGALKSGAVFLSVSGVVPEQVRRRAFSEDDWVWIRDGSNDLKAGCFIFRKR